MFRNSWLLRIAVLFLAITCASAILINQFGIEFGQTNYFDAKGYFFLIFVALFPRLTLLFSSVVSGGVLWWLGFIFTPRLLVAILATISYWNTNKILVLISWMMAIGGETTEKVFVTKKTYDTISKNTFEAEYKVIK